MIARPRRAGGLAPWLALSLAMHGLLLALPEGGGGSRALPPASTARPALPVLRAPRTPLRAELRGVPPPRPANVADATTPPPPIGKPVPIEPVPPPRSEAAASPSPLPSPPRYRRPSEVTDPPHPLTVAIIDVDDPGVGRDGARFTIEVLINETGSVDGIETVKGYAPPEIWPKVVTVFGRTPYQPGRLFDTPVKTRLRIEVWLPPAADNGSDRPR